MGQQEKMKIKITLKNNSQISVENINISNELFFKDLEKDKNISGNELLSIFKENKYFEPIDLEIIPNFKDKNANGDIENCYKDFCNIIEEIVEFINSKSKEESNK